MSLANHWWQKGQALTVGSIGNAADLDHAQAAQSDCDLFELRLDILHSVGIEAAKAVDICSSHPYLITARCPSEGGAGDLESAARHEFIASNLEAADAIDLEVANIVEFSDLVEAARQSNTCVIASAHNFELTPGSSFLKDSISRAHDAGADIAKIAARVRSLDDIQRLLDLFDEAPLPLSVMGMGELGPASRVMLAQRGSVLNYGYLGDEPTAPGQWPARLLRDAIASSPSL